LIPAELQFTVVYVKMLELFQQTHTENSSQFRFSPDGSKYIFCNDNGGIHCGDLNMPMMKESAVNNFIGEAVYDIDWFSQMKSNDISTQCYISTSSDHPIHLWDIDGVLRCTYRGHNHLDELDSAISVKFNLHGTKIYAGSNQMIRLLVFITSYLIFILTYTYHIHIISYHNHNHNHKYHNNSKS
jgi:WD40 repeat protein